jgi:hypothetical protein
MGHLHRFWSLTRREKHVICEAGILLLLANLCVKTVSFRHIDYFLRARWKDENSRDLNAADEIGFVDLSVSRAANRLPWKSMCLSRSIAAFIMLRRRGIPAVLFAGVKIFENYSLCAHAWVVTAHGVIGRESENAEFTPLIRIGPGFIVLS